MYNKTYSYYVNPAKRLFCSDAQGTPIATLPNMYFGERPVFTLTFEDGVLVEGEKLVFVMDNENRFLDSHSTTGLAPVMAWQVHEITAEDVQNKSIELELYCFGKKYADVINGHDNAVTCILSLFIKSIDENLNCTFSTLATTLAYAEPTIISPDCVFDELPIDMYLTRDEMNALLAEVEAIQREAIEKAEQASQYAQEAKEAADSVKDLEPLILNAPPTTATVGNKIGKLALWHDATTNKDHIYHLVFISTSDSATLYHWEECVLESERNVAGGFAGLGDDGQLADGLIPHPTNTRVGGVKWSNSTVTGLYVNSDGLLQVNRASDAQINNKSNNFLSIVPSNLDYAVRSVLPNVTEIPAATSDYSLVDSSATTLNHSHTFSHVPTQAPTYRLPSVSDTTVSHYIELTVDFTNVQTYSFLDANGDALVPLFTPAIAAGDVYTFKMEYSAIKAKWLIYPQKQGAVADDFVMRGEVGAANGVAGLDSNGLVLLEQLPRANGSGAGAVSNSYGVVRVIGNYGIDRNNINGYLFITKATNTYISGRTDSYAPIVPANLNAAVTAALTDSKKISLTDAQKAAAQEVFGIGGAITEIPAATSEYTLAEGIFTHAPTSAPTYTLPNITDDIRTHEVVLIIDFSSVQTFSFLVDGGGDVTFQSYANPTMGDVWAFKCWWYGGKWRIVPTKIKNCVTRQLANGLLSITDAVAGDALALKMTAPRSVVVNQLVQNGDFSNGSSSWTSSVGGAFTTNNNVATITRGENVTRMDFRKLLTIQNGHKYIFISSVAASNAKTITWFWLYNATSSTVFRETLNVNSTLTRHTIIFTASAYTTSTCYWSRQSSNGAFVDGETISLAHVQLVDLTQYFNGDTALIDSITSWDDLVAYDPRFAQYVEYNTGTVTGVQPSVKVTGKNLFDKSKLATDYGYTADTVVVDGRTCANVYGSSFSSINGSHTIGYSFGVPQYCAISFYAKKSSTNNSFRLTFLYEDGTNGVRGPSMSDTWEKYTVVPNNKVKQFTFNNGGNGGTWSTYIDIDTIQLELGSVATSYEPYHDGGTAQAPSPLFAVGTAADEFEAVSGKMVESLSQLDLSTLQWTAGEGSYSATVEDIKSSTQNILLPNGYVGSVSGTTLTITASATPAGIMVYEKATQTTTLETPVEITLLGGANAIMQTDGGRLAPIDITYESDEL